MKHHKFSHTHVVHHADGSHTLHHEHEDGKSHKDYAVSGHDEMMDGMMDHTSAPNPGEAALPGAAGGIPPVAGGPGQGV